MLYGSSHISHSIELLLPFESMKIVSIETKKIKLELYRILKITFAVLKSAENVLVKITADEGITGSAKRTHSLRLRRNVEAFLSKQDVVLLFVSNRFFSKLQ
ncbi:MAG: hypothetical protein LBK73_13030 [Treponema sp.]|jgi:hypothetical protein|nr:hypothetical protein [Treponema sp.]